MAGLRSPYIGASQNITANGRFGESRQISGSKSCPEITLCGPSINRARPVAISDHTDFLCSRYKKRFQQGPIQHCGCHDCWPLSLRYPNGRRVAYPNIGLKNTWYILRAFDVLIANSRNICFSHKTTMASSHNYRKYRV